MNQPVMNYDSLSDTLYISFASGAKATGIELNEHILLRIDKNTHKALGITLFNYSVLAQKADFGPRSFPLSGLGELSDELQEMVVNILFQPPVNEILTLSTYTPTSSEAIPITSLSAFSASTTV